MYGIIYHKHNDRRIAVTNNDVMIKKDMHSDDDVCVCDHMCMCDFGRGSLKRRIWKVARERLGRGGI